MGLEYYIVNHKDKTIYELGKGNWFLFNSPTSERAVNQCLLSYAYTLHVLVKELNYPTDEAEHVTTGIMKLVNKASLKDIQIINDLHDEDYYLLQKGYISLGSRYDG